jgi:hypothetical protein
MNKKDVRTKNKIKEENENEEDADIHVNDLKKPIKISSKIYSLNVRIIS